MPGPYIHIAAADSVAKQLANLKVWFTDPTTVGGGLPQLAGPLPIEISKLSTSHPNYYALGAIGPDLFFFLPDFRGGLGNFMIPLLEFLDKLYAAIDDWILKRWEVYIAPVGENVEEALSRLTGDLSSVVQDILGSLVSILMTAVIDVVTQAKDWWELFSLGLNKGYDNKDFFWSDMLHYRKTSEFAGKLWKIANNEKKSDRLRAYALGYMTHLGTDTIGHAYVNEKSGGPFRTHWQRHHLVENHMDASSYDVDHATQSEYKMLTESALHYRISLNDDGSDGPIPPPLLPGSNTVRGRYERRFTLDLDSAMPDELAELLFEAMEQTYNTGAQSTTDMLDRETPAILTGDGRPRPDDIKLAYSLLFRYLKHSMLDGLSHEKPQPPDLFPNLDFPLLTNPGDDPPGEGDDDDGWDWLDILLSIFRFIAWIVAVAGWIVTIIPAIILDIATYLPRLAAYYGIQLPLFYMLKALRSILVMTGYVLPMQDEIDLGLIKLCTGHGDIFQSLLKAMDDTLVGIEDIQIPGIQQKLDDLLNSAGVNLLPMDALARILGEIDLSSVPPTERIPDPLYPHSHPEDEFHHPWAYPSSPREKNGTFAGPFSCGDMPHVLLDGQIRGRQNIRSMYEHARSPAETDNISTSQRVNSANNMGDPVNFSSYLIWQLTRTDFPSNVDVSKLTDWNLDADRGYGYRCWDWDRHSKPKDGEPRDEAHHVLKDEENNPFMEPCTPPTQSDKNPTPPNTSLALHYADQQDFGCSEENR